MPRCETCCHYRPVYASADELVPLEAGQCLFLRGALGVHNSELVVWGDRNKPLVVAASFCCSLHKKREEE